MSRATRSSGAPRSSSPPSSPPSGSRWGPGGGADSDALAAGRGALPRARRAGGRVLVRRAAPGAAGGDGGRRAASLPPAGPRDAPGDPSRARRPHGDHAAGGGGMDDRRAGGGAHRPGPDRRVHQRPRRGDRDRPRRRGGPGSACVRSEEHTSELQSLAYLVCRLLLEKKKKNQKLNTNDQKKNQQLQL